MTKREKTLTLISSKPYLFWSTKDYASLSDESVLEGILSYGDWEDYVKLEEIFGVKKLQVLFENLKGRKRINLRPQTINYFNRYFDLYA